MATTAVIDIEEALAVFLCTPITLSDEQRNYHLRCVQTLVQGQISNARRPQTAGGPLAITIQETGDFNIYDLLNEDQLAQTVLRLTVWGKNPYDVRKVKGSLHVVLTNYVSTAAPWNGVVIEGVTKISGWTQRTDYPVGGNDEWTFALTAGYLVSHCQVIPADGSVALG